MKKVSFFFQHQWVLYGMAIAFSLLLSTMAYFREGAVNPDAVCYLISAEAIGNLGLRGAMHLCGQAQWPFYSLLVYGMAHITHLSYVISAYTLDSFFTLISVLFFILIVKELGGSLRVLWLAAAVILLSHQFNSIRDYVIRDHGFWAFYLLSIFSLLRFFRKPQLITAIIWNISIIIATLFRIEGVVFLLVLPFLSLFFLQYTLWKRIQFFLMLNLFTFLICFVLASWMFIHPEKTLNQFGRIAEVINQFQHGLMLIAERYQSAKMALAEYVLKNDYAKELGLILFIVLISWYLISIMMNVSWVYVALILYAWYRRSFSFTSSASMVLGGYLLVNVLTTFGFLVEHFFLSKRYLIALSLILMLWVPFALEDLIRNRAKLAYRFSFALAVIFIFFSSLGGIFNFGASKAYIANAGSWLAKNVPSNATLYANDYQVMYYSEHFGQDIFEKARLYSSIKVMPQEKWKQYDYLALRVNKKEDKTLPLLQEIHVQPIQIFSNQRGDRVIIYKTHL